MKKAYDKILRIALRIACISFILAVTVNEAALAAVQLDIGSAPLDPEVGPYVYPGDSVQIPIILSNYEGGPVVSCTSTEITYASTYLTPLTPILGPQGIAAGKDISWNISKPGVYTVLLCGIASLNTPILNGIVAYANFKVNNDAPAGTYTLVNKGGCTEPDGTPIPVSDIDGFIEVTASDTSTTTSVGGGSSTTTTTAAQEECAVTIAPSTISVASTETVDFSSTSVDGENCNTPQLLWSVGSSIGSTIDANGIYTAGTNTTGADAVETILVSDAANATSATATVSVSALPVGTLRIVPKAIRSFPLRQHLQLLLLRGNAGSFSSKSKLSFNPQGDINPLMILAAGRIMLALVSVNPDVLGTYDVKVSTATMLFLNQDSLKVGPGSPFLSSQNKTVDGSNLPKPGSLTPDGGGIL